MKIEKRLFKNVCSVELCGVEPNEIKEFTVQDGIVTDKEARARIRDGALVEVKKVKETAIEKKG